ncbi:DUF4945 domain-containing protein [Parapedobacter sp. DT-150]|uniref:DUF4945 domain-containing protein n=1 Tax=Parapedobacter sp. DT-150 TaxID=3396162 RepID=UPI003F1A35FD
MKNLVHVLFIAVTAALFTGCYDRGIIDHKDFDHALPVVENLNYTKEGDIVQLTWEIPADISPAFRRPLEISIQKVENDIYREIIIVGAEGTSRDIAIDPSKTYRFVVKLAGYLTDEARETGKPDRVYSQGQILEIE